MFQIPTIPGFPDKWSPWHCIVVDGRLVVLVAQQQHNGCMICNESHRSMTNRLIWITSQLIVAMINHRLDWNYTHQTVV